MAGGETWIVEIGEPLPVAERPSRLMRAGQIARRLAASGETVRWWVSEYSHSRKQNEDREAVASYLRDQYGITVEFLKAYPYPSNRSPLRVLNNRVVTRDFVRRVRELPKPKSILCCYPLPSLAAESVRYARANDVFCIVDIRDLWPDSMYRVLPAPARAVLRAAHVFMRRRIGWTLSNADALTVLAPRYEEWVRSYTAKPAEIHAIPLSYDVQTKVSPEARLREEVRDALRTRNKLQLALVGNISHVPRFDIMIDGLRALSAEEREKVRVLVCGTGDALEWLKKETAGLPVEFLGFCSADEIASVAAQCDAGLLLYPNEADFRMNYPNKVGEYLAFGLPIISSLAGAVSDLIDEAGIGWFVEDAAKFGVLLSRLMDKPEIATQKSGACDAAFNANFNADVQYGKIVRWLARENCHDDG